MSAMAEAFIRFASRPRVALAFVAIFAILAALVASGAVDAWDRSVAEAIYDQRPQLAFGFFTAVSFAGTYIGIIAGCATACALLATKRRFGEAAFVAASLAALWLLNEALKLAFARERPSLGWDPFATGHGFPSGHAMVGGAMVLILCAVATQMVASKRARWAAWACAGAFLGLLAYSRLFLGVHYPTDVLGGALLAIAWTLAAEDAWKLHVSPRLEEPGAR